MLSAISLNFHFNGHPNWLLLLFFFFFLLFKCICDDLHHRYLSWRRFYFVESKMRNANIPKTNKVSWKIHFSIFDRNIPVPMFFGYTIRQSIKEQSTEPNNLVQRHKIVIIIGIHPISTRCVWCALAIRQKMRRLQAIVLFAHHHRYTEHHCKYIREITIHKFSPFTQK